MSTLCGQKSRVTTAIGTLTKMISAVDSSYLTALILQKFNCETFFAVKEQYQPPSSQWRERKLEILKELYELFLLHIQTQTDRATVSEDFDQFWNEVQGDKHESDALETITALDTQLMMAEAIEASLRSHHQLTNNIVYATASLILSTSPLRNTSPRDQ
ncbi:unnamed protein product [Haemonchus placei]|uniref:Ferritin n=1 Tax=Haemonchus placei TaxID=6290 RepID=A0A0N4WRV0_HAEPC|nr:unnamed protein product [Haemonchus placei]